MDNVVLDIETSPLDISDKAVIDYQIRRRFKRNFHPAFARVVAAGLLLPGEKRPIVRVEEDEKNIIEPTWEDIRSKKWEKLVSWNGIEFDIPFLKVRSRMLSIRPVESIETVKFLSPRETNHIDCMWLLQGQSSDIPPISLEIAARLLDVEYDESKNLTPSEITSHFKSSEYDKIKKHCSQHVRVTAEIFEKILSVPELRPRATRKQINFIMSIAKREEIDLKRREVETWTKKEASKWINKHKR